MISIGAHRILLFIAILLAGSTNVEASVGTLEVWFRAFIPNPSHAGKASKHIYSLPHQPNKSIVKVANQCFSTDHRGFSTNNQLSSRIDTKFSLQILNKHTASIVPRIGHSKAAVTAKVNCKTGITLEQKPGVITRDHVGRVFYHAGTFQVLGQVAGRNEIPLLGKGPQIDYSFDLKWRPNLGQLTVSSTFGDFPAFEMYARASGRSWVSIIQQLPSGTPWTLFDGGLGINARRVTTNVYVPVLEGT